MALALGMRHAIAQSLHTVQEVSKVSTQKASSSVAHMAQEQRVTGTIRPHGSGQWLIRLSAGKDPLTGKRRQPSRVVTGTRTDAQRELLEFQYEMLNGQVSTSSMTVDQLFDLWIESPTKGGRARSASTRYNEIGRYRRYIQPALGKLQVSSIKPKDLSLFYDALLIQRLPGRSKPLSPQSVNLIHSLLRAMFNWAWRREYIKENPALRADNPSVALSPPVAPERSSVSEHLEVLWVENDNLALAIWLAATLGLRRSEVIALRWSDIDFRNETILVRHGVVKMPGEEFQITDTKTGLHGHADFPLHSYTKKVLDERLRGFRRQLNSIGSSITGDGFILSSHPEHATPLHPDALTKALRRHCTSHPDLKPITMQALRKYAASDLAGTGADETTASALLRNRPETARRHYQAAQKRMVRQHALGLADRLTGEVA